MTVGEIYVVSGWVWVLVSIGNIFDESVVVVIGVLFSVVVVVFVVVVVVWAYIGNRLA